MSKLLDPRTKFVMVICISTLAIVYSTPFLLLGVLFGLFVILLALKVDLSQVYRRSKKMIPLLLMLLVIQSIFSPAGKIIYQMYNVPLLTTGGIIKGLTVVLRMIIILSSAMILTRVNSYDLMLGLVQWKVPYEIAFMVFIAARFLPLFTEEARDVFTAIQMRGVNFKDISLKEKINVLTSLLIPIVFGTVLKAQKLAIAMESRGARAYSQRSYMRKLVMNTLDKVLVGSFIGSTGILLIRYFVS